ncbi:cytidine deaminase [Austwickia chelonae]|uniref:cytidine deaminase n=1 Tax=Austwickia chelonae TaxID=100225 RepID=UPI000E2522BB|nr:cytidine deaminase [Austwickia chelonae]
MNDEADVADITIDWDALHAEAVAVMKQAYAPYSNFPVGVAALVDDGRIVSGCNVENASYGLGLCAECGLVSELAKTGGGRLVAVWCVDAREVTLMPCGRCRQVLYEFGGPDCRIQTPEGRLTLKDILPQAFGPADIELVTKA